MVHINQKNAEASLIRKRGLTHSSRSCWCGAVTFSKLVAQILRHGPFQLPITSRSILWKTALSSSNVGPEEQHRVSQAGLLWAPGLWPLLEKGVVEKGSPVMPNFVVTLWHSDDSGSRSLSPSWPHYDTSVCLLPFAEWVKMYVNLLLPPELHSSNVTIPVEW